MTLTLTITNAERLVNDGPLHLVIREQGAVIGRSARCDWVLPDAEHYISSRHCEVAIVDGRYVLSDISTNGTILNGAIARMSEPRRIERGDRFRIGHYDVVATLADSVEEPRPVDVAPPPPPPATDAKPPAPEVPRDPVPLAQSAEPVVPPPAYQSSPNDAPPPLADDSAIIASFAAAAGVDPTQFKSDGPATLERAGELLKHLVTGLVTLVEARSRAKSELGADRTALSFDGNNPIKFARRPDHALAQLLNPRERGFMAGGAAVDDAFNDLQAHQLATLKAMQGALRATLDRFSPTAIKARADTKGAIARILPGAREAALWQAYEREFAGVADESDEAFMDVFAKEFRTAYLAIAESASGG